MAMKIPSRAVSPRLASPRLARVCKAHLSGVPKDFLLLQHPFLLSPLSFVGARPSRGGSACAAIALLKTKKGGVRGLQGIGGSRRVVSIAGVDLNSASFSSTSSKLIDRPQTVDDKGSIQQEMKSTTKIKMQATTKKKKTPDHTSP